MVRPNPRGSSEIERFNLATVFSVDDVLCRAMTFKDDVRTVLYNDLDPFFKQVVTPRHLLSAN
jgi:hypothetical protein